MFAWKCKTRQKSYTHSWQTVASTRKRLGGAKVGGGMTERVCEEKEKRPRLLYNARCLDKLDVGLDPDAIATVVRVCV